MSPLSPPSSFVSQLREHLDKLHSLATRWDRFECDVTNLLNWITNEANRFSGEVTTQGDKGVGDHIESCKELSGGEEGECEGDSGTGGGTEGGGQGEE